MVASTYPWANPQAIRALTADELIFWHEAARSLQRERRG